MMKDMHALTRERKREKAMAVQWWHIKGVRDTTELERMRAENKRIKDQVEEMGYKIV
jgi:hypothetical protein